MALFNNFPYTDLNDINLDYTLQKLESLYTRGEQLYSTLTTWQQATDAELEQWKAATESSLALWKTQTENSIDNKIQLLTAAINTAFTELRTQLEAHIAEIETTAVNAASAASDSATAAAGAASAASINNEQSKEWAIGETLEGDPVPDTNPAYENNAKYYADLLGQETEQIDQNTADITDLKSALTGDKTITGWESGDYKKVDGTKLADSTKIRNPYMFRKANNDYILTALSGYEFSLSVYKNGYQGVMCTDGNPYKSSGTIAWYTTFDITKFRDGTYSFRVILRNANDPTAEMTVAEGSNLIVTLFGVDNSLTISNMPADAKTTGDKIDALTANVQPTKRNAYIYFPTVNYEGAVTGRYDVTEGMLTSPQSNYVWIKFESILARGFGSDVTLTWSKVQSDCSTATFETSPNGVANSLKLANYQALLYDFTTNAFNLIANTTYYATNYPNSVIMAVSYNGRLIKGVLHDSYEDQEIRGNTKRITALENGVDGLPSYFLTDANASMTKVGKLAGERMTFSYITDTHASSVHYKYLKYINDYKMTDFSVIGGDINYKETDLDKAVMAISGIARDVGDRAYFTRGNHDGLTGNSDFSSEIFFNLTSKISPFIEGSNPLGYYYADYERYKIRLIVMNDSLDDQARRGFNVPQLQWLCDSLNAGTDWRYIVISHGHTYGADHGLSSMPLPSYAQQFNDILIARQNATTYSYSSGGNTITADFTNLQPNKVLFHLFGHMHLDCAIKIDGVWQISTICSLPVKANSTTNTQTYDRTVGTNTEYAIDVFSLDLANNVLDIVRIGAGVDRTVNLFA